MKNCRRGRLPALGLLALSLLAFSLLARAPGLHAETRSLFPLPEARLGGMGGPHFRLTWFAGEASMLGGTAALGGMREPAAGSAGVFVLEPEAIAQVALGPYCRLGLGPPTAGRCPSRRSRASARAN